MERIEKKDDVQSALHLAWIDWMKAIAMFFIIAGHLRVPGFKYIYVFSVPCFFIISGFLSRVIPNAREFWSKLWYYLVVPMLLLFLINQVINVAVLVVNDGFSWNYLWKTCLLAIIGMHGENYAAGGLAELWFVYTLILCKVLLQYMPQKRKRLWLLVINTFFLLLAICFTICGFNLYNAFVNVLLAMPFFCLGNYLSQFKTVLSNPSRKVLVILLLLGMLAIFVCGYFNDIVMLYNCSYGSSLLLCLIGGVLGSGLVYASSFLLRNYLVGIVNVIGGGTIIILGLHQWVIALFGVILRNMHVVLPNRLFLVLEALIVLCVFIPIIIFCKKHFPLLYGKLRLSKTTGK